MKHIAIPSPCGAARGSLPLILVVLLLAPGAVRAEAAPRPGRTEADTLHLYGTVVDSASGAPLPATAVRVLELARQDLTHDDGGFHLSRLAPGRYTLVFEHLGYHPAEVEVTVPREERLVVQLRPSALDLPGVIVTATIGARSRQEAHALSQVLDGRDLQRQLDVTLAETLDGEAGLASASMGPGPARPVIRGLGGDRILLLEDGERVGDVSSTSSDHAVAMEAGSAERIEVVRGPAALFYGSNALGGVINVVREEIPASLPDHATGSALVQGQSVNRGGMATTSYRQALGRMAFRVEASGRTSGDTRTAAGPLANSGIETYSGAGGAAWLGGFGHAGAALRLYRSEYGIPPDPVTGHEEGVTVEVERDAVRGEAVVEELSGLGQLTLTGGYTRYDHRELEESGAPGTAFGQNTGMGELVLRHGPLGPFSSGGFGLRAQWEDFASDNGRSEVRSQEASAAAYGVQELELGRLLLELGARYDVGRITPDGVAEVRGVPARDRTFHNVSGSVSGLFEFATGWRLGASVSRAFRAPSADELFSQGPHLAAYTYEIGNPELDPETGLGLDAFLRVDRPGISVEVGTFWNEISDYSYPTNTGERRGSLFVYRFVNTDARFVGAEASGRWVVTGPVVLDGAVSWVRATNVELDQPLPLIPPLNSKLSLRYDRERYFLEARWRGAVRQDRVPSRPDLPADADDYCDRVTAGEPCQPVPGDFVPTPGYSVFGAAAGYRWFPGHQVHSVTLSVDNLTDELYRSHLSRIKLLSPEPGIGVTLSYRASF